MEQIKIYIIAGEASGDYLVSQLVKYLNRHSTQFVIKGIFGALTEQELQQDSLFNMQELSVMGFIEVIKKILHFKQLLTRTVEDILQFQPDIILTVDSLGFNKRVIRMLNKSSRFKRNNTLLLHYVAPTVWAWKPHRAKELAQLYDHLFCILPFEKPYFTNEQLPTTYIGHPIVELLTDYTPQEYQILDFKQKYAIHDHDNCILLMPGSRLNEIKKLLPLFLNTIIELGSKYSNVKVILPTINQYLKNYIDKILAQYQVEVIVLTGRENRLLAFQVAKLALVASGTATLELALYKVPSVVAYKVNFITAWIASKLIKVKYASLINLIANQELIPELIQQRCTKDNLLQHAEQLLHEYHHQQDIKVALSNLLQGINNPSERLVANIVNLYYQYQKHS